MPKFVNLDQIAYNVTEERYAIKQPAKETELIKKLEQDGFDVLGNRIRRRIENSKVQGARTQFDEIFSVTKRLVERNQSNKVRKRENTQFIAKQQAINQYLKSQILVLETMRQGFIRELKLQIQKESKAKNKLYMKQDELDTLNEAIELGGKAADAALLQSQNANSQT